MGMVVTGILWVVVGLYFISIGIISEIPKPAKGCNFLSVNKGYKIEAFEWRDSSYSSGKKPVHILTLEKIEDKGGELK